MTSAKYAAVLFDLDGTLLDTEALSVEAGMDAFAALGLPGDRALLHGLIGKDYNASSNILRAALPGADLGAFAAAWMGATEERKAKGIPVKPGARELLSRITLPRALVTSSFRENARTKLAATDLPPFDQTVTFDDVTNAKPDPEPYLLAARLLGVDPAACLAFEDSETGAESAHRAGMTVVQVPDILQTEGRFAHHVAPDLLTGARMAGLLPVEGPLAVGRESA